VVERKFLLPESDHPVHLMVAINQDRLVTTIRELTHQVWALLGIMVIGILILITVQISWSLWPLRKLQRNLKEVRAGNINTVTGEYPLEIQPLVDDLNALLFHYQEVLERARNHSGNLSHPRVDAISMAMDKVYAAREVVLVNELDSELMIAVEKRDTDEMLGNLIENSYKWASSLIRVHKLHDDNGFVTIVIEDDGPGIADNEFSEVLKRGVRLDESTPGTGLGLNIVNELCHSYRGQLKLSRSKLGGLKAELTLPLPRH